MTRHLERLFLRFLLWAFALTEEPNVCHCEECASDREKLRAKRRKMAS